ncbi:MAG TPA: hypothetical protein VF280_01065 [Burkholderiales bacterium]
MERINDTRIGAGIAGLMLLGIAAVEFFAAGASSVASAVTGLAGAALLVAGAAGLRPS